MACTRGCCDSYAEHLRSLTFTSAPSPVGLRERQMSKDHDAYRRLRKEGLQPRSSTGAAQVEMTARSVFEVEGRPPPAEEEL